MMRSKDLDLASMRSRREASAGMSASSSSRTEATCMTVGKLSLEEADMLTWSLGCTGFLVPIVPPSISIALFEMTSLAFMLDCVPDPVCQTTKGKWSMSFREATSSAACTIAFPILGSWNP